MHGERLAARWWFRRLKAWLATCQLLATCLAMAGCADGSTEPFGSGETGAEVCLDQGPTTAVQPLDSFDWLLLPVGAEELGYRYYSRLAGDRGEMGGGLHPFSVTIANGEAHLTAEQGSMGTSWVGLWYSLSGTAREGHLVLDPRAALPGRVSATQQVSLVSWTTRVKGRGRLKVELKTAGDDLLAEWTVSIDSQDYTDVTRTIPGDIGPVKLLNVVAESPSDLTLDEILLETSVPALTPLRYAFLLSYGQLMRCFDPQTGLVRDHAQWPTGDFDAVPGMGFVALAAAAASDLSVISRVDAVDIASRAIDALLEVPGEPQTGWLPHWLKSGQRHPDSEWSTVDTALALLSAIQAATMLDLGERRERLRQVVDELDFDAVTNAANEISHGLDGEGRVLSSVWGAWGGETALLQLLRGYRDPCLPDLSAGHQPPVFRGRGFIMELGALLVDALGGPEASPDHWNVNWYNERVAHYEKQRSHAGQSPYFGLSPAEVISQRGATAYLEGGTGTESPPSDPVETLAGFDGPWRMPHYMAMSASLNVGVACRSVNAMRDAGLLPPLGGPAEAMIVGSDESIRRWHSVQTALNAFFNTLGYYHAVVAQENLNDAVYQSVMRDERYVAALGVLFPPTPSCAPGPTSTPSPFPSPSPDDPAPPYIELEAEGGSGAGQVMPRSNASGDKTVWLHAGESRSHSFSLPAPARYSVGVRYSNDNFGPLETVSVSIDGAGVGSFQAQDTGDGGEGWNVFAVADAIGSAEVSAGAHSLVIQVSGGDGYGVEIDITRLTRE